MKKVFIRSAYNYDMDEESFMSGLECQDKTLAQQQFREEADINTIVQRFGLTGELPTDLRNPQYGDYTGIFDYQSAMNTVRRAKEEFMRLPAHIRARFHNEPQELLEFCENDENKEEAIKLGLAEKRRDPVKEAPQAPLDAASAPHGATPHTPTATK